tara:strand:- start:328 stop:537 length:210 start_codon:yes stop_codon:yes gene_type:complete
MAFSEQLSNIVKKAMVSYGVETQKDLAQLTGLSNPRVRKVANGDMDAKVGDYILVMKSLGQEDKIGLTK